MTVSPPLKQEASISEQAPVVEQVSRLGPGSQLKTAREACRMSVDTVADRLHLAKSIILDIEADHYNSRLGFTFIRGYLRAYARLVKVPPDLIVKAFDQLGLKKKAQKSLYLKCLS